MDFRLKRNVKIGDKDLMKNYIEQTYKLIDTLTSLEEVYRSEEEVERSREFFNEIKPKVESYLILLESWGKATHQLASAGKLQVFPQQIDATIDNMKALIMHSFYKDVRKRRYMEIKQACYYIFMQSIEGLEE